MKKIFVYVLLCLGLLASCTSGTEGLDQSEVFTVSLDSIDKDCKGGKAEIVVESLCSWTISDTENVDWFTLSATKGGAGNSVITVDIAENKTPEGKRATIVVGNKLYGFSHKITISQEAGNLFITPSKSQIESTAAGSSMTIDIDSNVEFTASSSESWCKVNPTSLESGKNSVDITIDANPKTESRSAVVTFSNEQYDYSTTISVSQVAFVPNLEIDSEAINATSEGTAKSVAVTSNISWSASCDADWVTLTPTNGEKGDSTLKITVAANTKTVAREAVVTISNSEYKIEKQIAISQEAFGPSLNVDTESITAYAEGVTKSIAVTSNISWSASCNADWVTLTPTNGEKGSSTLKITVAANTKTVAREAVVTISNSEYKTEKQIAIAQEALIPNLEIGTKSININAEGGTESIAIASNIPWQAHCDANWVTISPKSWEKGNLNFVIDIDFNTNPGTRKTTIKILNEMYNISKEIVITQIGCYCILYTSTNGEIVTPTNVDVFGANILSNTYRNGKGVITFDGEVTSIGNSAFGIFCSNLTSITIPNSVTEIGNSAFSGCSSLTSVTIPDSVTTIGNHAFSKCSSLSSITIPDCVTTIGDYAFRYCSSLTSVTIPDSVTTLGDNPFKACTNLAEFNGKFASADKRCLIIDDMLISFTIGCGLTEYSVHDSVTEIGNSAFYYCSSLTTVTIPDSVTKIGGSAFYGCSSLASITIPDSVNEVGTWAFCGCSGLTSVTIPDSVTEIEDSAFYNCSSLTSVTIPNSVTEIGYAAFGHCSRLKSVYCEPINPPTANFGSNTSWYAFDNNASGRKIYVPQASVDAYKSASYWSDYSSYIVGYDFNK